MILMSLIQHSKQERTRSSQSHESGSLLLAANGT